MELHAAGVDDLAVSRQVSAELRAEMARRKRTAGELAAELGISAHTAGRKLNGATPFDVVQLAAACRWLGMGMAELLRRAESVAVAS